MSTASPYPFPNNAGDDGVADALADVPTKEQDGETVLDPDANDDNIDSAEADRIAAEDGDATDAG